MMMWLAFAIGCGHCLVLSVWAATRLRHHLRPVAMSRYQPLPPWRWRLPSLRAVGRFAIARGCFCGRRGLAGRELLRLSELAQQAGLADLPNRAETKRGIPQSLAAVARTSAGRRELRPLACLSGPAQQDQPRKHRLVRADEVVQRCRPTVPRGIPS